MCRTVIAISVYYKKILKISYLILTDGLRQQLELEKEAKISLQYRVRELEGTFSYIHILGQKSIF